MVDNYKLWTKQEIKFLRDNYGRLNYEEKERYLKQKYGNIDFLQFRLIKLEEQKGIWKRYRVKTFEELDNLLKEKKPLNSYWGTSYWLNPLKIEHPKFQSDRIILGSDIFIETDGKNSEKEMKKVLKVMSDKQFKLKHLSYSGGGYHSYWQSKIKLNPNFKKRELEYKKERNFVRNLMFINHIKIDYNIFDIFRVSRIFSSKNGNSKGYCKIISKQQLKPLGNPHIKRKNKQSERNEFKACYISQKYKKKYVFFMNNPNLIRLKRAQNTYNLGTLYFFRYNDNLAVLSLKLHERKRLDKINKFMGCKIGFIRTSEMISVKEGKILKDKPLPYKIIISPVEIKGSISPVHSMFLRHIGFEIKENIEKVVKPAIIEARFK